jgi:hypothetical protein
MKQDKSTSIFNFFNEVLATPPSHSHRIKFDTLGLPITALSNLGSQFTVEEV